MFGRMMLNLLKLKLLLMILSLDPTMHKESLSELVGLPRLSSFVLRIRGFVGLGT